MRQRVGKRFSLGGMVVAFGVWVWGAGNALAYTPTYTPAGGVIRWQGGDRLELAGNASNASGIPASDFYRAVTRGLQRWQQISFGALRFDYWQGTDAGVFEPNSNFNGLSSIYFASNLRGGSSSLSERILGVTQVWYNINTGGIQETDIILNDRNFSFTTQEQDTSGYGSGRIPSSVRPRVFIENVITHELGHAFGLSHSGNLQSTMLFMESPEQAHLGCDETSGVRALYPGNDLEQRGNIAGQVIGDQGQPLFGAHVVAVSRRRATVMATALTDRGGYYSLTGLEQGNYILLVEPFYAGAGSLPSYFNDMNSKICPGGQSFGRSVLMDSTGFRAKNIEVPASGGTAQAPALQARCGSVPGAVVSSSVDSISPGAVPVAFEALEGQSGFAIVDRLSSSNSRSYLLKGLKGEVELHTLSYSLYSPARFQLSLTDASGTPVAAEVTDRVYQGDSGYVNYDARLVAHALPTGDYILRLSGSFLSAPYYPAGQVALDYVPFLLVTGSVDEPEPALSRVIPDNARCRMTESFQEYFSPPGNPPRHSVGSSQESGGGGFCGIVQSEENTPDSRNGGGSPSSSVIAGRIVGWFLPWALMLASLAWIQVLARRARAG